MSLLLKNKIKSKLNRKLLDMIIGSIVALEERRSVCELTWHMRTVAQVVASSLDLDSRHLLRLMAQYQVSRRERRNQPDS